MTASIAKGARAVAAATTEIVAVQPSFGPLSIEGHYDEAFAAAGVAEQVRLARDWRPEAAFHAASMIATGFSVVTTMTRTCIMAESKRGDYAQPLPKTYTGWAAPLGWPE